MELQKRRGFCHAVSYDIKRSMGVLGASGSCLTPIEAELVCCLHDIQSNLLVDSPICCVGFSSRSHRCAVENPPSRCTKILRSFARYQSDNTRVH